MITYQNIIEEAKQILKKELERMPSYEELFTFLQGSGFLLIQDRLRKKIVDNLDQTK